MVRDCDRHTGQSPCLGNAEKDLRDDGRDGRPLGAGLRGLAGAYFRPRTEQVVAVRDLDLRMEGGESLALDPEPAHESEPCSVPNAKTGSSAAARRAGRIPLANPTTRLTPSASNTKPSGVRTGSAGMNR